MYVGISKKINRINCHYLSLTNAVVCFYLVAMLFIFAVLADSKSSVPNTKIYIEATADLFLDRLSLLSAVSVDV